MQRVGFLSLARSIHPFLNSSRFSGVARILAWLGRAVKAGIRAVTIGGLVVEIGPGASFGEARER
jgi:hypothetical protein